MHCENERGLVTGNSSIDRELDIRIGLASSAFNTLNNIWRNSGITINTKVKIYETGVTSILLYGCATWALKQQQVRRPDAFHHYCLRRLLKIRPLDFIPNSEVR